MGKKMVGSKTARCALICVVAVLAAGGCSVESGAVWVADGVSVIPGPVNGVRIERYGKSLAVYGDPREDAPGAEQVLFTHHRRDVVWAGK